MMFPGLVASVGTRGQKSGFRVKNSSVYDLKGWSAEKRHSVHTMSNATKLEITDRCVCFFFSGLFLSEGRHEL